MNDEVAGFQTMECIKQELAIIAKVIPRGSQIVYLDYPVYDNIGDLLIMKGTEAFFSDYGIKVRKRYSYVNFRSNLKVPEDWIIVCQGGGNFGDTYPHHQQLREKAVKAFPRNRIVILPQTIYFKDAIEERRSLQCFSTHSDLHLFVRDNNSYLTASCLIDNVYLSPDMAHQLYPLPSTPSKTKLKLALLRNDKEVRQQEVSISYDRALDWPQLFSAWDHWFIKQMIRFYSLDRRVGNIIPLQPLWYFLANKYIGRAVALFNQYDQIVTSRLHGHILSCLMDKPNLLLDNSYGKNMSYYRLWTHRLEELSIDASTENNVVYMHSKSS
ncbi:polysaccharide pyruvyl transferase family protein [Cohnella abietis]|uniref:Putative pyruvyl transferase EpsO n=1 Tax=Cohnella abietis TaxID=2507935 RepID=A0A3T1D113_9BACL|nr:polysaccharide pyruvyl transferase family protein [Cohnella abietis]BBI31802.1 putative pyruvyl transferase EpsO [Cohnella abietis]